MARRMAQNGAPTHEIERQGRWKQGGGMVGRYTRGESAGSVCGIDGNVGASPRSSTPAGRVGYGLSHSDNCWGNDTPGRRRRGIWGRTNPGSDIAIYS